MHVTTIETIEHLKGQLIQTDSISNLNNEHHNPFVTISSKLDLIQHNLKGKSMMHGEDDIDPRYVKLAILTLMQLHGDVEEINTFEIMEQANKMKQMTESIVNEIDC
ncbi:hypothetical protein [Longirhabdus pacifica]|uniref:hypothetical protein n=1 Tax=Longirhabdus pacifica TaxID=2305227 RepID=UPI001008EDBE|nr:hypothetical protein [Longirhabdus pacifica]